MTVMALIGRNAHIFFAFYVIYIKSIVSKNRNTFRKSHKPARLYFFIQQSYCTYTFQNGHFDRHGSSSVKTRLVQVVKCQKSGIYIS